MARINSAAIARYLQQIEGAAGRLDPESVVEAARDPESPIHDRFTWDDTEAAHQHRIWQARNLIRKVTVTVERVDGPTQVPVFVHTTSEGYRSIDVVVRRPDLFAEAIAELSVKVEALRTSIDHLRDVAAADAEDDAAAMRLAMIAAISTAATALHEAVRRVH